MLAIAITLLVLPLIGLLGTRAGMPHHDPGALLGDNLADLGLYLLINLAWW